MNYLLFFIVFSKGMFTASPGPGCQPVMAGPIRVQAAKQLPVIPRHPLMGAAALVQHHPHQRGLLTAFAMLGPVRRVVACLLPNCRSDNLHENVGKNCKTCLTFQPR